MSYIDAYHDKNNDLIKVVERTAQGQRVFREYPVNYNFYIEDPRGNHRSIFGDSLSKIHCRTNKEFRKELAANNNKKTFETDLNRIFTCLADNYLNQEAPNPHILFVDIESDFSPDKGFASPEDPFMPITAISVYLQWTNSLITLALPPKSLAMDQAEKLVSDFDNVFLFDDEKDLLNTFIELLEDADVFSGWNSESYDLPYIINRITTVMSKSDTRRLCLWDQLPKRREFKRYGKSQYTYDTIGRVHLDSLEIYKKYNYEERHSYTLDAIAEYELGERKTQYEGTLDQLYNNDFKKFIEYNRQDCELLYKLENKLKFIDLANAFAHENTVLLPTVMGTVAPTDQAIINEAHQLGLIVPDKKPFDHNQEDNTDDDEESKSGAAGAYVAYPKKGLHEWVGSIDLNSLYPSTIRALNMCIETIVGQLRPTMTEEYIARQVADIEKLDGKMKKGKSVSKAWEGIFGSLEYTAVMKREVGTDIIVDWEDGNSDTLSAAEIYHLIFESNQPWMLSANGTIFTREKEGLIPGLLSKRYSERKELQSKMRQAIRDNNKQQEEYWDKRQLVKKLFLNATYGAILNRGSRFNDIRIGQSTTLSGRQIVKHMSAKINEIITGEYDYVGKSIIYNDTDSGYFTAYPTLYPDIEKCNIPWNKETIIQLYDNIAEETNTTFPQFMKDAFHCPLERGAIIKAGREIVASKALFITKKRYAALYFDKEGKRTDVNGKSGKIKAMGLDLRRSDTPKFMQDFLMDILERVLEGHDQEEILNCIREFRLEFKERPGWEKGAPKRANNVTKYQELEEKKGKVTMPGHVRAAINWNTLKQLNNDRYSMNIVDGTKVIVCKLKNNPLGYTSVAYPVDEMRLPQWFKDLPFDHEGMEETIIDLKLNNLLGVLNYDLDSTKQANTFASFFSFD